MSSNKKSFKLNKTKSQQKNVGQNNIVTQTAFPKTQLTNRSDARTLTDNSIVTYSIHKAWPDLQLNQSHLFFECTLFLYSVLALFLQYLNLYRTMWWLPKSHWPSSLKYHLINPYILSCIGLLLGVRVTKCFWDTITERIDFFALGQDGWKLTCWKVFEYAIVKTPLTTIVSTSFMFSFTRIYVEFGVKSFFCFASPFLIHLALFQRNVVKTILSVRLLQPIVVFLPLNLSTELLNGQFDVSQGLINLATFAHLCNVTAAQIRDEATFLLRDFELRCRYCIYTALLTAYFAIFMPRTFLPQKTIIGMPQFMLIDDVWVVQLFSVVALTSFSLYFTYLFPINYFDLLYRCVVHLGQWELIQPATQQPNNIPLQQQQRFGVRIQQNEQHNENYESFNETSSLPYQDGTRLLFRGNLYIARSHPHYRTVCAEPGNKWHLQLYKIAKNPVALVSYMCIFQCALVAFEFWLLLLTNDWQQIVTLVLLMFANYLLLAKMFKDRVIIDRIYKPSEEDLQLIKQLQEESEQSRREIGQRKIEKSQKR
uniref:Transmembrane protein n=1 Tax=Globodera pallida TaxID=36090 RepID=A0A183BK23_GLOPA